jgi:peptidoglycan/xylan/chitin deacetylase (PgdA/CDA1 family)
MSNAADLLPTLLTTASGAALFLAAGTYGMLKPTSRMWGPVISRGPRDKSRVALTFDDGPLPGTTDRILDVLGELKAQAVFFVIGQHAEKWPHLVKRIHEEGHVVSNHTFAHHHFGLCGLYRYWQAEINRTDDVIERIIGCRPALFRPPMGYKHWHVMNAAADTGHAVVAWSRRARDVWDSSPAVILSRLLEPAKPGDVLLLHDGNNPWLKPQDRSAAPEAVRALVEGLRQRGLEPVRLDELLKIPAYQESALVDSV